MELPKLPVTNVVVDGLWEEQYGPYTAEQVQGLMRQAVLMEREQCALICINHAGQYLFSGAKGHNAHIKDAIAIRART